MSVDTPVSTPLAVGALPVVIQGGMGVAVSSWQLARAVSLTGQLGVVSGTALDVVLARRLQDGDTGGGIRRAVGHFPVAEVAERVLTRYFRAHGRRPGHPYLPVPRLSLRPRAGDQDLTVVANFVEVWLAKEAHCGQVGINFLEKVQMATPAAAYGAMLAGVDYVLMGAGIPTEIPQLLDRLARHEVARLNVHVDGASTTYTSQLEPATLTAGALPPLHRPKFLAIVSAHVLAAYLAREDGTRPDGFVIEGPSAGGHNAPPRGRLSLDETGQPIYGPRDYADLDQVAGLGLPFWLAGSSGTPEQLSAGLAAGATGVQVGTLFALSAESGLTDTFRHELLTQLGCGTLQVRTDALASPTGFPFKVASLPATLSEASVYAERPRLCDLGYLRVPYERKSGQVGYRCPGEPVHTYLRKGGAAQDTVGRKCLCNSLAANVGLGQIRHDGYTEAPLLTLGANLDGARQLLKRHPGGWTAREAVNWLLEGVRRTARQYPLRGRVT
jgi:NAD(P)H-dependent flavin oxidoreductase YrpB (nitropropane dioxygenase family)